MCRGRFCVHRRSRGNGKRVDASASSRGRQQRSSSMHTTQSSAARGPQGRTIEAQVAEGEPSSDDSDGSAHHLEFDPAFPDLPASVPLTYTLSMKACLSEKPSERPSFAQVLTLLADMRQEVGGGHYINSEGRVQVRLQL
jgi:hypothetical protein